MNNKGRGKGLKILVALLAVVLIIFSVWYFILKDNDFFNKEANGDGDIIIDKNVNLFLDTEALEINGKIKDISFHDDNIIMNIENGSSFDGLNTGDVFMLKGDENSSFGETYVGKIINVDDNGTSKMYTITEPCLNEVFDEIDIDYSEYLTLDKLIDVQLADGVTLNNYTYNDVNNTDDYVISSLAYNTNSFNYDENNDDSGYVLNLDYKIYDNSDNSNKTTFKITGKVAFDNLSLDTLIKWNAEDIDKNGGFSDLSIKANADFTNNININYKASDKTVDNSDTEWSSKIGDIKVIGLKEKRFPIAYLKYSLTGGFGVKFGKENIKKSLEHSPLTVGVLLYVDLNGKLSFEVNFDLKSSVSIGCNAVGIKDGEQVWSLDPHIGDLKNSFSGKISGEGSFDATGGFSVNLNILNINIAELSIGKIGIDLSGKFETEISGSDETKVDILTDGEVKGKGYIDCVGLNLKIMIKKDDKERGLNKSLGPVYEKILFEIDAKTLNDIGISTDFDNIGMGIFNNHVYVAFNDTSIDSWEKAEEYCESLGGHLATITSAEENDYVYNLLKTNYDSAYIGLTDSKEEGVWEWVTGEPVEYTNWADGEPNNERGIENYAMFYYRHEDGRWNDGDFGHGTYRSGRVFICEWDTY